NDLSLFFFSSRRRHTRSKRDWSSDVCSSDLQRIFWTPGSNLGFLHYRQILYHLNHRGSPLITLNFPFFRFWPFCCIPFFQSELRSEERRVGKEDRVVWVLGC